MAFTNLPIIDSLLVATQANEYDDVASFPAAGTIGKLAYAILEGALYVDNGSVWELVADSATGISSTAVLGNDNRVLRSDGADRLAQPSTVVLTDAGALSGITDIALTGAISGGTNITLSGTVDGRNVSADGLVLDQVVIDLDAAEVDIGTLETDLDTAEATLATAILDADFGTDGIMVRTGAGAYASRTITGTANQVVVADGNGDAGNPTLSLPQSIHTAATPTFASLTLSNKIFTSAINNAAATDAGTTVVGASVLVQLLEPDAATVAAHTITFPATPANGQHFYVANSHGTNVITALTMGAGGDTIVGALTALGVGAHAQYIYVTAITTWVRVG